MALAIDTIDGWGLSNVVHHCQSNAVFAVHYTVKAFNQLYITSKMERFSFKSGHAARIAKQLLQ